jgi:hypothetical protein
MDLFKEIVSRGIQYDHHESDLYIPLTQETIRLVKNYNVDAERFVSNIDGKVWFDIPFAYTPFWEKKQRRNPYSSKSKYCHERVEDPKKFDKRSFRTVQSGKHKIVIGCPKGSYDSKTKTCRIGTRIQKIEHPAGEGKCPVGGKALKHNPYEPSAMGQFYDYGKRMAGMILSGEVGLSSYNASDIERYFYNEMENLEDNLGCGLHQIERDILAEGFRHGLEGI